MERNDAYFENLEDQAAFWLVRLSASDCTPEDRFAFETWRQEDPAHDAMYLRLQSGNALVDRHMNDERIQMMLEQARITDDVTNPKKKKRPYWSNLLPAAATGLAASVTALLVLTMTGLIEIKNETPKAEQPRTASASLTVYETAVGERSTITLPDATTVTVNTNSQIEVLYSNTARVVRLKRGQAFFEVQKDINRPFVVEAGQKRIVALGTAFDVRLERDDYVQVTLVEGRVTVGERSFPILDSPSVKQVKAETRPIELIPGQRLVAKHDLPPEVHSIDTYEETSWRNGKLIFRGRPLGDVIDEMNRYGNQQLVLSDDPRVKELKVSGVFSSGGRTDSFVNALEALYPVTAKRSGESELVLVWRD